MYFLFCFLSYVMGFNLYINKLNSHINKHFKLNSHINKHFKLNSHINKQYKLNSHINKQYKLNSHINKQYISEYINLNGENIHSLILNSSNHKENILYIHGFGSTAFISLIKSGLNKYLTNYNIYAIDLPGFGRSTFKDQNLNFFKSNLKHIDYNTQYTNILYQYMNYYNITTNTHIMGHSFGAYQIINLIYKYPQYSKSMILISPAGLSPPTSLFSKFGLNILYYKYGFILNIFIRKLILKFKYNEFEKYYLDVQSKSITDKIINQYIYLSFSSHWTQLIYDKLINISSKIPIALIYGQNDTLTPPTIITGTKTYIIKNAGHSPMNSGFQINNILQKIFKNLNLNK